MESAVPPDHSPRLGGIREHFERVKLFYALAHAIADPKSQFRLKLAAIYSCRAMTELLLEAGEKQEIPSVMNHPDRRARRDAVEELIAPRVPFYDLIERIRIHDFHRFGLEPPDAAFKRFRMGGPVKVGGGVSVVLTDAGLQATPSGNAHAVKCQRPLLTNDDTFFDDDSKRYVTLDDVLGSFLTAAPRLVPELEALFNRIDGPPPRIV